MVGIRTYYNILRWLEYGRTSMVGIRRYFYGRWHFYNMVGIRRYFYGWNTDVLLWLVYGGINLYGWNTDVLLWMVYGRTSMVGAPLWLVYTTVSCIRTYFCGWYTDVLLWSVHFCGWYIRRYLVYGLTSMHGWYAVDTVLMYVCVWTTYRCTSPLYVALALASSTNVPIISPNTMSRN